MATPAPDRRTHEAAWKPTPPPPRPKRHILGWIGLGAAGLIVVVIGLGLAGGEVKPTPINPPTARDRKASAPLGAKSGPKGWRTVASASGNASKRTPVFALYGGRTRLRYTVTDPDDLGAPTAAIYLLKDGTELERDGGFPEVDATEVGSDTTELGSAAGRYYLYVNAANSRWSVAIQEYR
jgi:hypothetical protein